MHLKAFRANTYIRIQHGNTRQPTLANLHDLRHYALPHCSIQRPSFPLHALRLVRSPSSFLLLTGFRGPRPRRATLLGWARIHEGECEVTGF
eukprot:scaffold108084_cov29-Tisochrysis_lutea.AAC.6